MSPADIPALISQLRSDVVIERQRARHELERLGESAVDALVGLLGDARKEVRWEAAKTLLPIASPKAAEPLTALLDDDDHGTRWVVAEALIRLGRDGLVAVLRAVTDEHASVEVRNGVHHVCIEQEDAELKEVVQPVIAAIESASAAEKTPVAASRALRALNVGV